MVSSLVNLQFGLGLARLPMILQTEAAECGLACLAMVAAQHGHRSDLPTLRQRFSLSLKGATMADLVRMAGELHLNARPLRAEMEHLAQLQLPCVLHWDLNHFVVLASAKRGVAVIHDPARGVRRMKLAEVSRHFTGVVMELSPTADFKPQVERQTVTFANCLATSRASSARWRRSSRSRSRSRRSCCSRRSSCNGWSMACC